ncbi:hypothetical protein LTS08_006990 [Lithohypha guttulata]|nr:hypothetical protein LTS08_006990 [Lithohypha guttulata]
MSSIEVVASVNDVASAGFTLSLILNAISCEIANAPCEIKAISKSVTLYSLLLKQTAAALEKPDSVHSEEATRTTEQVLEESNAVFDDINAMLERVRTRQTDGTVSPSMPQKIRWSFKKHSIEYLLGRLDRLQMSLSLMLQIIQLGTTMASTSRHDPPERVRLMMAKVSRERVEAQTVLLQYFQESQTLNTLYMAAREEATEYISPLDYQKDDRDRNAFTLVSSRNSQMTKNDDVVPPTETGLVTSQHKPILTGLGDNWARLGASKEEMVRRSEEITNQLLERWTIWRQRRDQEPRQARSTQDAQYKSQVQDLYDEEDSPFYERFQEREDGAAGKYLEGPTTDWRHPHSADARQEARRLRKAYEPYQPSIEGSSDIDASPGSNSSRKRPPKKHIIDSDPETSDSEHSAAEEKTRPRRRSSAIVVPVRQRSTYYDEPASISKSYNVPSELPAPQPSRTIANTSAARPSVSTYGQQTLQRPFASPDQSLPRHSFSSPTPAHTHNNSFYQPSPGPAAPAQYFPSSPQSQAFPQAQGQNQQSRYTPRQQPQSTRYNHPQPRPPSREGTVRPRSRDGKPSRSPSRLSREYTTADYKAYEEERKRHKKESRRNLSNGAAKGLLAGGGIAVLLEALDSLS